MCVTHLLRVYCDGVFLYLHTSNGQFCIYVGSLLFQCFWYICSVCNINMSCIFNILRFCVRIICSYSYNHNCIFCVRHQKAELGFKMFIISHIAGTVACQDEILTVVVAASSTQKTCASRRKETTSTTRKRHSRLP